MIGFKCDCGYDRAFGRDYVVCSGYNSRNGFRNRPNFGIWAEREGKLESDWSCMDGFGRGDVVLRGVSGVGMVFGKNAVLDVLLEIVFGLTLPVVLQNLSLLFCVSDWCLHLCWKFFL